MNSNTMRRPVAQAVAAIHAAYDHYAQGFDQITGRARSRFERRDWSGAQADATDSLQVRLLRAQGNNSAADLLAQQQSAAV